MLEAYHYIYQAMIRCQVALGGTRGRFTEWKAGAALLVLDCWWALIVASWIKVVFGYDLIFARSRVPLVIVGVLFVFINQRCLSSKEVRAEFEKRFRGWPQRKRTTWDIVVGVFVCLTAVLVLYSAVKVRDLGLAH